MKFGTQALIAIGVLVLIGFLIVRGVSQLQPSSTDNGSNVRIENGQQIVTIKVKAGYLPLTSEVKAGMPTILRFETNATFDCSSTIRIPSLNISQSLPASGTTDIALGAMPVGTIQGTCGMGMYRFSVDAKG